MPLAAILEVCFFLFCLIPIFGHLKLVFDEMNENKLEIT
jgi:hypothetical protein